MIEVTVVVRDPKVNVICNMHVDCRCVMLNLDTEANDKMHFLFDSIDDLRAFHGIIGVALQEPT